MEELSISQRDLDNLSWVSALFPPNFQLTEGQLWADHYVIGLSQMHLTFYGVVYKPRKNSLAFMNFFFLIGLIGLKKPACEQYGSRLGIASFFS